MWELYLITRLNAILAFLVIVLAFAVVFLVTHYIELSCDGDGLKKSTVRTCWIVAIITAVLIMFIPNKKDALAIYGIGKTIEYIKENEKAKQLPDKAVKALDAFLEEYINEEEKETNK